MRPPAAAAAASAAARRHQPASWSVDAASACRPVWGAGVRVCHRPALAMMGATHVVQPFPVCDPEDVKAIAS
eukprot:354736-Chlamydomonas_euryale.AAC.4